LRRLISRLLSACSLPAFWICPRSYPKAAVCRYPGPPAFWQAAIDRPVTGNGGIHRAITPNILNYSLNLQLEHHPVTEVHPPHKSLPYSVSASLRLCVGTKRRDANWTRRVKDIYSKRCGGGLSVELVFRFHWIKRKAMKENEISKVIVDAAIEVHRVLGGPGLLEDVYEEALAEELRLRGLVVERQVPVRVLYKGRVLQKPLRLDMKIESLVLVDNKATTEWHPVFQAQMLTYLRVTGLRLGLVLNFGERVLKGGVHRVVNGLPEDFAL
jgi:GxxExxY protein